MVALGARHQQRLQFHQNHEPRPGPQQQPRHHQGPGWQPVTHPSLPLISFASSDMPLSTGHGTFCLSPTQNQAFAHHKSVGQTPARCWVGLCFLLTPGFPQACTWVPLSHLVCQGTGQNHASSSQRDNSSQPPGASGGSWLVRRCCGNPLEGLYTQILYAFIYWRCGNCLLVGLWFLKDVVTFLEKVWNPHVSLHWSPPQYM